MEDKKSGQNWSIDVDEEYLEGLFLRLNDQIGRMVKKDCYTIQEAYILIHSWSEVLAEVFGKLTDKYSTPGDN